jgi:pimeloyl-ACP methyl ester carboxylesterase
MFLIERRAPAVLAALATASAVAVLPELWDRVRTIAIPASTALHGRLLCAHPTRNLRAARARYCLGIVSRERVFSPVSQHSRCAVKTMHVVAAIAAWLFVWSKVDAAGSAEVSCRRADALVALAAGQPANYLLAGELCAAPDKLKDGATVQLLVHGATYNHEYWNYGSVQGTSHSYARAVAQFGLATFAPDEIGVGASSHPVSTLVTLDAATYVAHQIVNALRNGSLAGTRFGKVIAVGHSLGSAVVWNEAIRYADIDGVVVTGVAHARALNLDAEVRAAAHSAVQDPRFETTGLDSGYLTTVPGTRARLFVGASIPEEEGHKDVVPATELATALPVMTGNATRAIRVPVLSILGSNDAITCAANTPGNDFDCSSGAAVARQEAPFYSPQARLHACVIPDAGHDLNLTPNHGLQVIDVVAWSAAFVDRRLARRSLYAEAQVVREVDPTSNDSLPWNCAAPAPASRSEADEAKMKSTTSRIPRDLVP